MDYLRLTSNHVNVVIIEVDARTIEWNRKWTRSCKLIQCVVNRYSKGGMN